jgi:hypothetical protein
MKNLYILAFALFIGHSSSAQFTIQIGTSDMPSVNDSLKVSLTNTVGLINPVLTDTNYVWDFSSLVPTSQNTYHFDNPATFAFPFNLLFNSFNTSYGLYNYTPDSIATPFMTIHLSKSYDFFKNSATDYKEIGKGMFINGLPANSPYSKPDFIYRFPMVFGNIDSCDYKYGTSVPKQFYYGQKGHRVNTVDGYGTLKTPFKTYTVLRLKSVLTMIDTIYVDTFHVGFNRPRALTIQYKWLATGGKIPVLEVDGTQAGGVFTVTNVIYRDSARAGVSQVGIAELYTKPVHISTYPNPSSHTLHFDLSGIPASCIDVFDSNGRKISTIKVTGDSPMLDVSAYPLGIYFFDVKSKEDRVIGRGKIAVAR